MSPKEERAARRFVRELRKRFPEIAETAAYVRGYEETVYVMADLPDDEDEQWKIHEAMSPVGTDIVTKHKVFVLLMPRSKKADTNSPNRKLP